MMKYLTYIALAQVLLFSSAASAYPRYKPAGKAYHVAKDGDDAFPGTRAKPFLTIQHAADLARAGDQVIVHKGIYRERIDPRYSGTAQAPVIYRAAKGERVSIRGSEIIRGWQQMFGDLWRVAVPNALFGNYNPYREVIHGDWFSPQGWIHHTGALYVSGRWLREAKDLTTLAQVPSAEGWSADVRQDSTVFFARVMTDPTKATTEINVRETVFYPAKTGINYITVKGFELSQAATNWAPPTAEQVGLIGPHWAKGWVIERNNISFSRCAGISLGKYGDEWDNRSGDSAEGYIETVRRALIHNWDKAHIGGHIVRNNWIAHCGQAGIVGSLGAAFSTICGNLVHDIYQGEHFTGAEMGGIKLHGAIDVLIKGNHVYRADIGIWMDWMAQGTRVSGNLLHENEVSDIFFEVDHGPFVVDNNVLLSRRGFYNRSEGGAVVHNLIAGTVSGGGPEGRATPYFDPHSTRNMQIKALDGGDTRWLNNLILRQAGQNGDTAKISGASNVVLDSAQVYMAQKNGIWRILLKGLRQRPLAGALPGSKDLGKTAATKQPFVSPDDQDYRFDLDYLGRQRHDGSVMPGPLNHWNDLRGLVVWPVAEQKKY